MGRVEFLYWPDCPSHERALALLSESMQRLQIAAPITVICIETEEEAQTYQFYGSPTLRVNGQDIAPLPEELSSPSLTCRAYRRADGRISPLPPVELIEKALQAALI